MKGLICVVLPFGYITPRQLEKLRRNGLEIKVDGDKQLVSICGVIDAPDYSFREENEEQ